MTSTTAAPAPAVAHLRTPALARASWLMAGVVALIVLSVLSISFGVRAVTIDAAYVRERLTDLAGNSDLSKYIL